MNGRLVYMMAIQMPNITSYSGSWMVWFAEHEPVPGAPPGEIRAPEPLRKVDPKYIADAANERVEGIVRLSAVIHKDGSVGEIELLQHLDDRLDKSAEEALGKWRFEPATRDGAPVDIDAVFEIPFRLAPRSSR
jgi:TonB family protein